MTPRRQWIDDPSSIDALCGANLTLPLSGFETFGLAMLVRRVLEHPDLFGGEEVAAAVHVYMALAFEGFGYGESREKEDS